MGFRLHRTNLSGTVSRPALLRCRLGSLRQLRRAGQTRLRRRVFLRPQPCALVKNAGEQLPVGAGAQALQQVDEFGVEADQDARGVALDAVGDGFGGDFRRGARGVVKTLDRLARRALSVTPVPVRELRAMLVAMPPGCTTDSLTGLSAICNSWRRLSEKPRTANFAAA